LIRCIGKRPEQQHYIFAGCVQTLQQRHKAPLLNAIVGFHLLEHDPAKWELIFARGKREAFAGRSSTKTLDLDPIQSNWIMIYCARATRNSSI